MVRRLAVLFVGTNFWWAVSLLAGFGWTRDEQFEEFGELRGAAEAISTPGLSE